MSWSGVPRCRHRSWGRSYICAQPKAKTSAPQVPGTPSGRLSDLVERLEVDPDVMRHRAEAASADLLSERGGDAGGDPASYLGASDALIDLVLARWRKP